MSRSNNPAPRHAAVIVCYQPDSLALECIRDMAALFETLCLVDNSPALVPEIAALANAHADFVVLARPDNCGIATALNLGLETLSARGFDYVFLYDQDSRPDAAMIAAQLAFFQQKTSHPVAQVAPAYFDIQLGSKAPFIQLLKHRICRTPAEGVQPISAAYLITSGSCISVSAWRQIGRFDDALFIDCVDIEWGLRAIHAGWLNYGLPDHVMQHRLGDTPISLFGRRYPCHSPLRHYYFFRNTLLLLLRQKHIPANWKWLEIRKIPLRLAAYGLLTTARWQHCKMMGLGLWHGLRRRTGKLEKLR